MKLRFLFAFSKEAVFVAIAYILYFLGRGIAFDNFSFAAFRNAADVIHFEKSYFFFNEPHIQNWFIQNFFSAIAFLNWFYLFGFWSVILLVAVAFYVIDREAYYKYRTIAFISYGIALIVYMAFPLAPPRLIFNEGFFDTIHIWGPVGYYNASEALFYNPFAAMPSMHFGMALIVGLIVWRSKRKICRVIAVAYPATMLVAIIATANHYIVDAAGAIIVIGMGFAIYELRIVLSGFKPTALDGQYVIIERKDDSIWPSQMI